MPRMPTLFISHGPPDILLSEHPSARMLRELAPHLPRPQGIAVISAHWVDRPVGITGPGELPSIHDFGEFSDRLRELRYPARGSAELTQSVERLMDAAAIPWQEHRHRGLDHGAWIPLSMTYPLADVPVIQISLPAGDLRDCAWLGQALAPLAEQEVLILGSGGSVHNLRALKPEGPPDPWATGFEHWLHQAVSSGDFEELVDPNRHDDSFAMAHPSMEHFAPLVCAWAAGGHGSPGRRFHADFMHGNLGMSSYVFGDTSMLSL